MRVLGYVRVSTSEQASKGAGLEAQRRAIIAECVRRSRSATGARLELLPPPRSSATCWGLFPGSEPVKASDRASCGVFDRYSGRLPRRFSSREPRTR